MDIFRCRISETGIISTESENTALLWIPYCWAVCAICRAQNGDISDECERIIRGVATGPAAGQDSGTHAVILSLTHIIHADIKLFSAKCCVSRVKKRLRVAQEQNVGRLLGRRRGRTRSHGSIHTGSVTF